MGKPRRNSLDHAFYRMYRDDARHEQKGQCAYCYEPLTYRTTTADHKIARAKGGKDTKLNIVASCAPCNVAKATMTVQQFKNLIGSFPTGSPLHVLMCWSRRRINLQINRSCNRFLRFIGRTEP